MDTVEMLKEFAKEHGINVKEVNKFLSKWDSPKTIDELLSMPDIMRNHIDFVTWVKDPLKSFLTDDMYCERREVIDLECVLEIIADREDYLDEEADDYEEKMKHYQEIRQYLIDTKFGSVVYDW